VVIITTFKHGLFCKQFLRVINNFEVVQAKVRHAKDWTHRQNSFFQYTYVWFCIVQYMDALVQFMCGFLERGLTIIFHTLSTMLFFI
jgi:hypothetical protein